MSATADFYLQRADECARDAENTNLDNVRDRCRRSEAAWREMANRLIRTDALRASRDADRIVADAA
jgi:hypothetical protein